MAENDAAVVEVPEEGVVTVEVEGGIPPESQLKTTAEAEPKPEPKPAPRVQPKEPEEDTTHKALQEAVDSATRRAQAAEATALSATQQAAEAERRRQASEARLQEAEETAQSQALARVTEGIDAATRDISAAQKEYKTAMEAGNFEAAAEAQTRLSKATARLDRFEAQKEDFEAGRTKTTTEGRVVDNQQGTATVSPFEQYVAGFAPAAQTWLRAHPECVPAAVGGKADMNAKMMSGHYLALSKGYAPNSTEYFNTIEESTGHRKPATVVAADAGEGASEQPAPKPKPQARPSAPPSREPPGSQPTGGTRQVKLSKDEQEAARLSFPQMKPNEAYAAYARNKVELEAEGKLGRTTH